MQNNNHFKNLDTIRFIAASMVVTAHVILPAFKYWNIENSIAWSFLSFIGSGSLGVQIFFVLSGFLISYLLIKEHEKQQAISLKKFYMRRILRIWPLYFLVMLFSFLIIPYLKSFQGNVIHFEDLPYYLSFTSNFAVLHNIGSETIAKSITWSIAIEEQFYVFWPLLFLFPKRTWLFSILFIILFSLGFQIIHSDEYYVLYLHTISLLSDLAIGGLLAFLIKDSKKIKSFFENATNITHLFLFAAPLIIFFYGEGIFHFQYGVILQRFSMSLSIALLISAQALSKKHSVFHLSNWKCATRLGKYTYGIYLIHPIVVELITMVVFYLKIPNTSFISAMAIGLTIFIVSVLLSIISYKYYESRFLKIKEKYFTFYTGVK